MWQAWAFLRKRVSTLFSKDAESPAHNVRGVERGRSIKLMGIFPSNADREFLHQLSARHSWTVFFASSCNEAREILEKIQPQIILLDREAEPGDWRYSMSSLAAASNGACVLLASRVIDENLWNAVVSNGGYDLVRKPLSEEDVLSNVRQAWSYWNATRRVNAAAMK